jgi:head-tail adaptor
MRIGPLHDRVRIDAVSNAKDAMGAPSRTWAPLWEAAASIETASAREYFTGSREEAADIVRIRMRYPPRDLNVTSEARAVDVRRGIVYAIQSVLFDDKRTLLTLACVSGVSDG